MAKSFSVLGHKARLPGYIQLSLLFCMFVYFANTVALGNWVYWDYTGILSEGFKAGGSPATYCAYIFIYIGVVYYAETFWQWREKTVSKYGRWCSTGMSAMAIVLLVGIGLSFGYPGIFTPSPKNAIEKHGENLFDAILGGFLWNTPVHVLYWALAATTHFASVLLC